MRAGMQNSRIINNYSTLLLIKISAETYQVVTTSPLKYKGRREYRKENFLFLPSRFLFFFFFTLTGKDRTDTHRIESN